MDATVNFWNVTIRDASASSGGAVYASGADASFSAADCEMRRSTAFSGAAGICVSNAVCRYTNTTVTDSVGTTAFLSLFVATFHFEGGFVLGSDGDAVLSFYGAAPSTLVATTLSDSSGVAVEAIATALDLRSCVLSRNDGGGLSLKRARTVSIADSFVSGNSGVGKCSLFV